MRHVASHARRALRVRFTYRAIRYARTRQKEIEKETERERGRERENVNARVGPAGERVGGLAGRTSRQVEKKKERKMNHVAALWPSGVRISLICPSCQKSR